MWKSKDTKYFSRTVLQLQWSQTAPGRTRNEAPNGILQLPSSIGGLFLRTTGSFFVTKQLFQVRLWYNEPVSQKQGRGETMEWKGSQHQGILYFISLEIGVENRWPSSKQTVLQRRYINARWTHEKMPKITSHQRNAAKTLNEIPLHVS